jgi:dCMP deaminase
VDHERPSWDDTWLNAARIMAQRSKCALTQVGAVVATHDNRVNSSTYNGPPRGMPAEGPCTNWCPRAQKAPDARSADYTDCVAIHAEANALIRADWTQTQGGTLYSTASCCLNCARLIANSGLLRVVHVVASAKDMVRRPHVVEEFLRSAGLDVIRRGS